MISGINSSFSALDAAAMRKQMFQKLDADTDGKITKDELTSALPKNGNGPSVDTIFSQADTNEDGSIDSTENDAFLQKMESGQKPGPPPGPPPTSQSASDLAQSLFKNSDSDGDGKITKDELTTALSQSDSSVNVDDLFKQVDTDEDGAITQTELETSIKKLQEEMQTNWALMQAAGANGGAQTLLNTLPSTSSYNQSGGSQSQSSSSSFSAVA